MMDDRVIYIRWSDDGQHIRKWDTKPFDGSEPMYSRSWLLSEERVEAAAKALWVRESGAHVADAGAIWDNPEQAEHKLYWTQRMEDNHPAYRSRARATLEAAIGEPYEFSGWVEVVEDGE